MKNQSDWNTFYKSGKIEDYLNFCQNRDRNSAFAEEMAEHGSAQARFTENNNADRDRGFGTNHAEFYGGFGTGAESGTHRGV